MLICSPTIQSALGVGLNEVKKGIPSDGVELEPRGMHDPRPSCGGDDLAMLQVVLDDAAYSVPVGVTPKVKGYLGHRVAMREVHKDDGLAKMHIVRRVLEIHENVL